MDVYFQSIVTLQDLLKQAGIASVIIGGIAVAAWGEPRLTRDVDLKVQLKRQDAGRLIQLLADYKILAEDPTEMIRKQALIFIQDRLGTRIDLLLADTSFDDQAIQRGQEFEIQPGIFFRLCTPEDLIIYKLISTRPRDHDDVRGVILRQDAVLDDRYVEKWLKAFEKALDDSTLLSEYQNLRRKSGQEK